MSPTGEGAVSLSRRRLTARGRRGAEVWAAGSAARAAGLLPPEEGLAALGTWSLSPGLASPRGFLVVRAATFPALCVSTGKRGSEMLGGPAGGLGGEAPAAQQKGGISVTWSEKGSDYSEGRGSGGGQ